MVNLQRGYRLTFHLGVLAFVAGALDPLEGSVVIALGAFLMAVTSKLRNDRHKTQFLIQTVMIITGVFFLFYFSSVGGFGGTSSLSWWYGILILPYPIAWIWVVILLLTRIKKGHNP
jgi:hypothetical protein